MAITTDFKTRMAAVSQQYKTASLVKVSSKGTHNPVEAENYGDKPITWFAPGAGKIKSTNIVFPDIPPGAETDMIVLKTDKVWVDNSGAESPDAFYHDFYDLFIAPKNASNYYPRVGWHKGVTRDYNFVLYDVELSSEIVETIMVTVPQGSGSAWTLENWYEALYQEPGGYWQNVTNDFSVARVVFHNGDNPEKIMAVRYALYFSMDAAVTYPPDEFASNINPNQKQSTFTVDLNSFKIAYDLDNHKNEDLDFTKKGSIVTNIEREYEEL